MCGQNLPVRTGLGGVPFVDVGAERAGRARHSEAEWARAAAPRMEDHKADYRARVLRDQSEDRELPPTIAVAVDNPSGTKPGMYWAVFDRSTMQRLSVWFTNQFEAVDAADDWQEVYGDIWNEPVAQPAQNMIWGDPSTERDWWAYNG